MFHEKIIQRKNDFNYYKNFEVQLLECNNVLDKKFYLVKFIYNNNIVEDIKSFKELKQAQKYYELYIKKDLLHTL